MVDPILMQLLSFETVARSFNPSLQVKGRHLEHFLKLLLVFCLSDVNFRSLFAIVQLTFNASLAMFYSSRYNKTKSNMAQMRIVCFKSATNTFP